MTLSYSVWLDLLHLKLLLVIQRRGQPSKNGTLGDAIMGDMNCLCEGEVDYCEVLSYAVKPPSSWTVPSSRLCPGRSCVVSGLHFRATYAAGGRTSSPVAKKVNPEIFIIARLFWLECIHISYSNILSFVGIEKTLGNFLYWLINKEKSTSYEQF